MIRFCNYRRFYFKIEKTFTTFLPQVKIFFQKIGQYNKLSNLPESSSFDLVNSPSAILIAVFLVLCFRQKGNSWSSQDYDECTWVPKETENYFHINTHWNRIKTFICIFHSSHAAAEINNIIIKFLIGWMLFDTNYSSITFEHSRWFKRKDVY